MPTPTRKPEKTPEKKAPASRRGDPDVVEKRRLARVFNAIVRGTSAKTKDGRTEKKRARLLQELRDGRARGRRELSPIDVLVRVQALMDLDEPLASIRKACPVRHHAAPTEELVATLGRVHAAYGFCAAAYAFVGIDAEALTRAGVEPEAARPGLARSPAPGRKAVRGAA